MTGNGKGKTTSALGMALRAAGHGIKTSLIQFIKGDIYSGEWDGIPLLDGWVELTVAGIGYYNENADPAADATHRRKAVEALELARRQMASGQFGMMILDEINNALAMELITLQQVQQLLDDRPEHMHLILTGRDAHPEITARADIVSEIQDVKHAFSQGIEPQPGIDY